MTCKAAPKAVTAALMLAASFAAEPALADAGFATLKGIPAEPMSAAEMEAVQGKAIFLDQYNRPFFKSLDDALFGTGGQLLQRDSNGFWYYQGRGKHMRFSLFTIGNQYVFRDVHSGRLYDTSGHVSTTNGRTWEYHEFGG